MDSHIGIKEAEFYRPMGLLREYLRVYRGCMERTKNLEVLS